MKWFRMDSDTPNHPTSRRVIRTLGNAGFGGLVRLWCFAAQYGKAEPGRCVDSDGDAIPEEDLRDASGFDEMEFATLIEVLIGAKCIDEKAWTELGELSFPGMRTRADEYTKKINRSGVWTLDGQNRRKSPYSTKQDNTSTREGKTLLEVFGGELRDKAAKDLMVLWNEITKPPIPRCRGLTAKRVAMVAKVCELSLIHI